MKENDLDAICMLENVDHEASSIAVNCNPKQNTGEEQIGRENRQREEMKSKTGLLGVGLSS